MGKYSGAPGSLSPDKMPTSFAPLVMEPKPEDAESSEAEDTESSESSESSADVRRPALCAVDFRCLGAVFWLVVACVMSWYLSMGWPAATKVANQTAFVRLREYLPCCSAPLMATAGLTGIIGRPFAKEPGLEWFVWIQTLAWGFQLSGTHVVMCVARHLHYVIGDAVVLAQCTFCQALYWGFYLIFRAATVSKLDSTLAASAGRVKAVLTLMDASFVLSALIVVYRVWVAAATCPWMHNGGKETAWLASFNSQYFLLPESRAPGQANIGL
mmetsp:Transcript_92656/g.293906  ORF Transcript_92656/g.293906 Transcript_92656/m.293906 type:complete len:271 (-) Transcript_92656:38-850(-)